MVFGLRTAINCGSGEIKKFIIRIITNRGSWLFRHDCNIMGIITTLIFIALNASLSKQVLDSWSPHVIFTHIYQEANQCADDCLIMLLCKWKMSCFMISLSF